MTKMRIITNGRRPQRKGTDVIALCLRITKATADRLEAYAAKVGRTKGDIADAAILGYMKKKSGK